MENVSSGYLRAVCINMVLAIVTNVLMVRYGDPFWYEAPYPLSLIFWWFLNSSYIKLEALNKTLSMWYTLITTPWLWYYLSKDILSLTASVAFKSTWCLMLIKPLECKKIHIHLRTSHMYPTFSLCGRSYMDNAINKNIQTPSTHAE